MAHVFISYSRFDYDFASSVKKKLEESGITAWLDLDRLRAGDVWKSEIDGAIYDAFAVIVIVSDSAIESHYVTYEWSFSLGTGTPVIPILAHALTKERHPRLKDLNYLDFSNPATRPWESLSRMVIERVYDVPSGRLRSFLEFRSRFLKPAIYSPPSEIDERNGRVERGEASAGELDNNKDILIYTGLGTFYQYLGGLTSHDRGFALEDLEWAMISNSIFWRKLAERQAKEHENKIYAFVTHSAAPDIWLSKEAYGSLENQKSFIKESGCIVRVFIGPKDPPLHKGSKYERAMRRMAEYKIDAFYMKKPPSDDASRDYTWIPSLKLLQTWSSRREFGNQIVLVDLSREDAIIRFNQATYWAIIKGAAVDVSGCTLESRMYPISDS